MPEQKITSFDELTKKLNKIDVGIWEWTTDEEDNAWFIEVGHGVDFKLKKYFGGYVLYKRIFSETFGSLNWCTQDLTKIFKILKAIKQCEEVK